MQNMSGRYQSKPARLIIGATALTIGFSLLETTAQAVDLVVPHATPTVISAKTLVAVLTPKQIQACWADQFTAFFKFSENIPWKTFVAISNADLFAKKFAAAYASGDARVAILNDLVNDLVESAKKTGDDEQKAKEEMRAEARGLDAKIRPFTRLISTEMSRELTAAELKLWAKGCAPEFIAKSMQVVFRGMENLNSELDRFQRNPPISVEEYLGDAYVPLSWLLAVESDDTFVDLFKEYTFTTQQKQQLNRDYQAIAIKTFYTTAQGIFTEDELNNLSSPEEQKVHEKVDLITKRVFETTPH
jgi:hypothetical protein